MEVEFDTKSVLPCPSESLHDVPIQGQEFVMGFKQEETYFQLVLARNGSPSQVSTAQYGIGIRTQFKPAPAISAKSSSVCPSKLAKDRILIESKLTMKVL